MTQLFSAAQAGRIFFTFFLIDYHAGKRANTLSPSDIDTNIMHYIVDYTYRHARLENPPDDQ